MVAIVKRRKFHLPPWADRLGAIGAFICALHCALIPLALALIPTLGLGLVEHLCERGNLVLLRPQPVEQVVQELGLLAYRGGISRLALQDFTGGRLEEVDGLGLDLAPDDGPGLFVTGA